MGQLGELIAASAATLVLLAGAGIAQEAQSVGRQLFSGMAESTSSASIAGVRRSGLSCSGCHGRDGSGIRVGGTAFPDIRSTTLRSPAGRPPYDEALFKLALRQGVSSSGRKLSLAMPRFDFSDDEVGAIWSYLQTMPSEETRGITSREIRFAIATLPGDEAAGALVREALSRAWRDLGVSLVNGRVPSFEVVVIERDLEVLDGCFAVVAAEPGRSRGSGLLSRLSDARIPVLGPMRYPRADEERLPSVVWLTAGESATERAVHDEAGNEIDVPTANLSAERARRLLISHFQIDDPDDVRPLVESGRQVVLVRPDGEPGNPQMLAPALVGLLKEGLASAGRDLTRSRFLDALSRVEISPSGWPALDYTFDPNLGSSAIATFSLSRGVGRGGDEGASTTRR